MNKIQKGQITVVRINLNNLDTGIQDPKITTLLEAGYKVKQVIPIEDGGHPIALFFLCKEIEEKTSVLNKYMLCITIFMLVQIIINIFVITQ